MDWGNLPEPAATRILQYLPFEDRFLAASACQSWYYCLTSPNLWQNTILTFKNTKDHVNVEEYVPRFGHLIQHLTLKIDQYVKENRENACNVLTLLSTMERRRLNSLTVQFTGENPVFYSGAEFVECFKNIFQVGDRPEFVAVDLDGVKFTIDESLVDVLTENNPHIETLRLRTDALICKVSPNCIKRTLQRCKRIKDISLVSCSLTDEVLRMFLDQDRCPLEHLSIMMRHEQKFVVSIPSETWAEVKRYLPNLRVSLSFDSTCPMDVIQTCLMPDIPVYSMTLAVYGPVEEEMHYLPIYYKDTLETLIIHPMNNPPFQRALVEVAKQCNNLTTLLVYCVLPVDIIDRVLENCPQLKARGTYILKSEAEPEPNWVMMKDLHKPHTKGHNKLGNCYM